MNNFEPELLETELQRLKPASPSEEFIDRCADRLPSRICQTRSVRKRHPIKFARIFKWLAPLTAAAAIPVLIYLRPSSNSSTDSGSSMTPAGVERAVKADNVEIVQQWVGTFDAVAQLPSGEPVRFRCSEWFDDVLLRDSNQGILIQHRIPRLKVEPVGFEIY